MYYIAIMWLIALSTILFAEYFHANSSVGKTQMYADLLSDGSAFAGNNGWGLDEKEANKAYKKLISLNKKNFKDCNAKKLTFTNTNSKGDISSYDSSLVNEKNKNNTTNATVCLNTKTLTAKKSLQKTKFAKTRITYSGGMKIVLEAYKHSYEYNPASQTWYIWGGGHGNDDNSWENNADCSGFVSGVFRKCGYYIPSWACTWDMESMGTLVGQGGMEALDNARPGDIILIWWSGTGTSDHVAIYAGKKNGQHYMIHSRGGSANDWGNPGRGANQGVHITQGPYSAARIMVRRIVDTTGTVSEVQMTQLLANGLNRNQAIVVEGLRSAGYNNAQIAGILGNLEQESSGCNPFGSEAIECHLINMSEEQYAEMIRNGQISEVEWLQIGWDYTGYGIVQWSYTKDDHERKPGLWEFAKRNGSNVTDINIQTRYLIEEMTNGSQAFAYNDAYFRSINDPVAAAVYFCNTFERAGIAVMSNRISYAQSMYAKLQRSNS